LNQASSGGASGTGEGSSDPALFFTEIDFSQGDQRTTGNSLDFIINGKGFFKIQTPDGVFYTRKGNFSLDAQGKLITQEGFQVMGDGGPITITGTNISVNGQGTLYADGNEVGRISLVDFEDPKKLMKLGKGLFQNVSDEQEIAPPQQTQIRQGYLELSNVGVADEMVQMIHCLRSFESYQKIIHILDGINDRVINDVAKLR
jgi:flagellar basal-body rod protein FlgG